MQRWSQHEPQQGDQGQVERTLRTGGKVEALTRHCGCRRGGGCLFCL